MLEALDLGGADVRRAAPTWAETIVRFLTHPVVSSLLMTIGILGIIVELRTPGFGVPGALGIASLVLFFWGHWLVRLAGWEELLLVGAGLILLAKEVEGQNLPGLGLLDLRVRRNAYGTQIDSFRAPLRTSVPGAEELEGVFIRAG